MFDLKSSASPSGSAKENAPGVDPTEGAAYKQETYRIDSTLTMHCEQGAVASEVVDPRDPRDQVEVFDPPVGYTFYGVQPAAWDVMVQLLGGPEHLLPTVMNPRTWNSRGWTQDGRRQLGGGSLGKTPGAIGPNGAHGITGWSERVTTMQDIEGWKRYQDLGILVRTSSARGMDIDSERQDVVAAVLEIMRKHFGLERWSHAPVRYRDNSPRRTVLFRVDGAVPSKQMPLRSDWLDAEGKGAIELLADGKQTAWAGTHPSGARFRHENLFAEPGLPVLTADEATAMWAEIVATFAADLNTPGFFEGKNTSAVRGDVVTDDPVANWLQDNGLAQGVEADKIHVNCPFESRHTGGTTNLGSASWLMPKRQADGAVTPGRFKCLHTNCQSDDQGKPLAADNWRSLEALGVPPELYRKQVKHTAADLIPFNQGLQPMPDALRPFSGAGEGVATLTPDKALQLALTQGANQDTVALGFEALHAGQFLFDGGEWRKWDGHRWAPGATAQARDAMRLLCRGVETETKRTSAKAFQDGAIFHAGNSRTFRRSPADFDADHWLLNTPGQTFNLRTGESWPNRPEDLISKMTRFAPSASGGERFTRFIDEITLGDKELGRYLQVMLGACLSGAVEEHWLAFWYGNGRNGKNTLIDVVADVMGDYAMFAPSEVLMSTKHDRHSTELADFCGMRLIVSSEVEDGAHWNESRINTLTGDAKMRARKMRTDSFEFPRTWKHIVLGNHRPQLRSSTQAVMSRFKIVPFKASFATVGDQPQSKRLPELLLAEGPYILHWLLEGHAMWLEKMSLPQCKAVEEATASYFKEQANSKRWLEERCDFGHELKVALQHAYSNYCAWHSSMGTRPESLQRFNETLENDNRIEKQKTKHGQMLFGVGLKDSGPPGVFSGVAL